MSFDFAARIIGKWCAHNNEFRIGTASIGCQGRGSLVLKLLKRPPRVGIGFYVYQEKGAMRARLQKAFSDWRPRGLDVAFCGQTDCGGDEGFALYAYMDDVVPQNLEDGAVNLQRDLEIVRKRIHVVVEQLKGIADFHCACPA